METRIVVQVVPTEIVVIVEIVESCIVVQVVPTEIVVIVEIVEIVVQVVYMVVRK